MPEEPKSQIEVFRHEGGVALVMLGASIIEYDGELTPGAILTPNQAWRLAGALDKFANKITREQERRAEREKASGE